MILASFLGVRISAAEPLRIWAAASLTDVLGGIGEAYAREQGTPVEFNFAGSSQLARQIEAGAPADIFISADEAKMNRLERLDLIRSQTRRSLLANRLVLIVNREFPANVSGPRDLAGEGISRVALAEPQTVPAGIYARTYLESLGLWRSIMPKVVPTQNVRAALAAVAAGNADAGFVYRTDALGSARVRVVWEVPDAEGPAIRYPAAVLRDSRQPQAAEQFLVYLGSPNATAAFTKSGFIALTNNSPTTEQSPRPCIGE